MSLSSTGRQKLFIEDIFNDILSTRNQRIELKKNNSQNDKKYLLSRGLKSAQQYTSNGKSRVPKSRKSVQPDCFYCNCLSREILISTFKFVALKNASTTIILIYLLKAYKFPGETNKAISNQFVYPSYQVTFKITYKQASALGKEISIEAKATEDARK